jgi:DNA-binding ferritin-like protein (Dps family)
MMITPDTLAQGFNMLNSPAFYVGSQFLNGYTQASGGPGFSSQFYGATAGFNEQAAAAFNMPQPAMMQSRAATMAPALMTPMATNPYQTLRPVPTMSFMNSLRPEYMAAGYARHMLPTEAYMEAQSQFPATSLQMMSNFGVSGLGTAVGAGLGSLIPIPGVGTVLGAAVGNMLGLGMGGIVENIMDMPGLMATRQIGNRLFRDRSARANTPLSMSESSEILNEIIKTSRTDPVFNGEDAKKLFTQVSQSNLISNAKYTVDQFKKDFKGLMETNRLISQTLKTSTEDALELMKGFSNVGITNTDQMQQIAFNARQSAWNTGTTEEFQMQQTTANMQMGNQAGLYGEALGLVANASNNLASFMVNDTNNADQFVRNSGGAANVAKQSTAIMQNMFQNRDFTTMLLGGMFSNNGELDRNRVQSVISGDVNSVELATAGQGLAARLQLNSPEMIMNYVSQAIENNPDVLSQFEQSAISPAILSEVIKFTLASVNGNENLAIQNLNRQGFGSVQFLKQLVNEVGTNGSEGITNRVFQDTRLAEIDRVVNSNMSFQQIPFTKRIQNVFESFMDVFREARTEMLGYMERTADTYYNTRTPSWSMYNNMNNYGMGLTGTELYTSYYEDYFAPDQIQSIRQQREQYRKDIEAGNLNLMGIAIPKEFTSGLIDSIDNLIKEGISNFTGMQVSTADYAAMQEQVRSYARDFAENYNPNSVNNAEAIAETSQINLLKEIVDVISEGNMDNKELKDKIQKFLIANENNPEAVQQLYGMINRTVGAAGNLSAENEKNLEATNEIIKNEANAKQYYDYMRSTDYETRQSDLTNTFTTLDSNLNIASAMTVAEFNNKDMSQVTSEEVKEYFRNVYQKAYGREPDESVMSAFNRMFFDEENNLKDLGGMFNPAMNRLSQEDARKIINKINYSQQKDLENFFKQYNRTALPGQEFEKINGEYQINVREGISGIVDVKDEEGYEVAKTEALKRMSDFEKELSEYGLDIGSLSYLRSQVNSYANSKYQPELEDEVNKSLRNKFGVGIEELRNISKADNLSDFFGEIRQNPNWQLSAGMLEQARNYSTPIGALDMINVQNLTAPIANEQFNNIASTYYNKVYSDNFSENADLSGIEGDAGRKNQIYELYRAVNDIPQTEEERIQYANRIREILQSEELRGVNPEIISQALQPAMNSLYKSRGFETAPVINELLNYNISAQEAGNNFLNSSPDIQALNRDILNSAENVAANIHQGEMSKSQYLPYRFAGALESVKGGGITRSEIQDMFESIGPENVSLIFDNLKSLTDDETELEQIKLLEDYFTVTGAAKNTSEFYAMDLRETLRDKANSGEEINLEDYLTPEAASSFRGWNKVVPMRDFTSDALERYKNEVGGEVLLQSQEISGVTDLIFKGVTSSEILEKSSGDLKEGNESSALFNESITQFDDSTKTFSNATTQFSDIVRTQSREILRLPEEINRMADNVRALSEDIQTLKNQQT